MRIARVEGGRIVEERTADATVQRPGFTFRRRGEAWSLVLDAGVSARVVDRTIEGPLVLPLAPDARGKIGDHLFQLVPAPPRVTPQLPASVIASERVDVRFAAVVAVSLLAHFGFVSAAQADWLDPVVIDDGEDAALITETPNRPQVPVEEKSDGEPTVATNTPTKVAAKTQPGKEPSAPAAPKPPGLSALDDKLDQLGLSSIASLGGTGPAKSKLLHDPSAADGALDDLAKKQGGVETDGPKIKGEAGTIGPIAGDGKLSDVGDTKSKTPVADNKPINEPTYKPNEPAVAPASGLPPKDANAVIAKNRWKLKACYTKELGANSDAAGTVRVTVTVSPEGDVIAANGASSDLSSSVVSCVESAFKTMKFGTDDNKSTFGVPIVFSKSTK